MSISKALILGMLIPVTLSAPLLAQDGEGRGPRMVFEQADLNGDGQITLEEIEGAPAARFAQTDTDGNGALSRDELLAARMSNVARNVDRFLERADANDDGALSPEEMADARTEGRGQRGSPERMFDMLDADNDGIVTQAEFDDAADAFMDRRGHNGPRHRG